jgi:hypothetical protein
MSIMGEVKVQLPALIPIGYRVVISTLTRLIADFAREYAP